jgi:hypothetical protein
MEPRSDYNNNPGNLRPPKGVTYQGQLGIDDKGFAIFDTSENGNRALRNDIKIKIEKGINTPEKFIDMYAPKGKDKYGDENSEKGRENYKIWLAHSLGLKSTTDPFPENALDKLPGAIKAFEGGTWNAPQNQETKVGVAVPGINQSAFTGPSEAGQSAITVPSVGDVMAGAAPGSKVGEGTTEETKEKVDQSLRGPAAMAGGILGASGTAGLEAGARIYGALKSIGTPEVSPAAQQRVGLQSWLNNLLSHEGKRVNLPLEKLEELVGKKINTMGELGEAYKTIAPTPAERVPKTTSVDPKTGVAKQIFRTVPGKPGIDLAPYAVSNARAAVQDAVSAISRGTSSVANPALRIGVGGLGGATAALSAYDASKLYDRLKKQYDAKEDINLKDVARLGTKGLATVGGLASIIPHPAAQATGLALQAPETAWSAYDLYQEALKNQSGLNSAIPVMSDEEASRPAFRSPRALPRRNP